MRFYTRQHKHYCGIDLHTRAMYVCLLDQAGTILVHKNLPTTPERLRAQGHKRRQGSARLIESAAEGVIAKEEFEPRIVRMK